MWTIELARRDRGAFGGGGGGGATATAVNVRPLERPEGIVPRKNFGI